MPQYILLLILGLCPPQLRVIGDSSPARGKVHGTVYFYSGESSINNFKLLKTEWDAYLSKFGDLTFQPFKHQRDFNKFVEEDREGIYLMSAWNYASLTNRTDLKPVLVGTINNSDSQSRCLWTLHAITNRHQLRHGVVATASSEMVSHHILQSMFGDDAADIIPKLRLLIVPKDIDALLAVSFGVAAAAIASEHSARVLFEANPGQRNILQEISRSQPFKLPLVVVSEGMQEDLAPALSILKDMADNPNGRTKLDMLGFESFRSIEEFAPQEDQP